MCEPRGVASKRPARRPAGKPPQETRQRAGSLRPGGRRPVDWVALIAAGDEAARCCPRELKHLGSSRKTGAFMSFLKEAKHRSTGRRSAWFPLVQRKIQAFVCS